MSLCQTYTHFTLAPIQTHFMVFLKSLAVRKHVQSLNQNRIADLSSQYLSSRSYSKLIVLQQPRGNSVLQHWYVIIQSFVLLRVWLKDKETAIPSAQNICHTESLDPEFRTEPATFEFTLAHLSAKNIFLVIRVTTASCYFCMLTVGYENTALFCLSRVFKSFGKPIQIISMHIFSVPGIPLAQWEI